jgi:RNA polymerase sigma-70 factor (ECF subfamily)
LFSRDKRFDEGISYDFDLILSESIKGNNYAINRLISDHYGYALKICTIYSKNTEDAKEHLNDGFLKLIKSLTKFDKTKAFLPWLRTIFIHTCIDSYRRKEHLYVTIPEDVYNNTPDIEYIISGIAAEEILLLINKLPTYCKSVFLLYVLEGYSHKEIAKELNISEGTSKSHFRDAKIKLRSMIMSIPRNTSQFNQIEVK